MTTKQREAMLEILQRLQENPYRLQTKIKQVNFVKSKLKKLYILF